ELAGRLHRGPPGAHRVDATRVGDHPSATGGDVRQREAEIRGEVLGEAERFVLLPVLLEYCEGQLSKRLETEVVDARVEQRLRRPHAVAVAALSARDPNRPTAH